MAAVLLREKDVQQLLTMNRAIDLVTESFLALGKARAENQPRRRAHWKGGALNVLFAAYPDGNVAGLKAYAVSRTGGPNFLLLLWDTSSAELKGIIEATHLSRIRTGAASAVATRILGPANPWRVMLFGAGSQAGPQLEALAAIGQLEAVKVYARRRQTLETFCREQSLRLGVTVTPADDPAAATAWANIIVTVTSSPQPVFKGEWLSLGTHINAVGSNVRNHRELDDEAVQRCSIIVIDQKDELELECGDLWPLVDSGRLDPLHVRDLGTILTDPGFRRPDHAISLFESQGLAIQDVVVGSWLLNQAIEHGIGETLHLL